MTNSQVNYSDYWPDKFDSDPLLKTITMLNQTAKTEFDLLMVGFFLFHDTEALRFFLTSV